MGPFVRKAPDGAALNASALAISLSFAYSVNTFLIASASAIDPEFVYLKRMRRR
jgi:hypothetical protein